MKRKWIAIAALFAALLLLSGIIAVYALQKKDAAQALKIGVSVYKSDDTFITGVMADCSARQRNTSKALTISCIWI